MMIHIIHAHVVQVFLLDTVVIPCINVFFVIFCIRILLNTLYRFRTSQFASQMAFRHVVMQKAFIRAVRYGLRDDNFKYSCNVFDITILSQVFRKVESSWDTVG